jgi:hypothetical protein
MCYLVIKPDIVLLHRVLLDRPLPIYALDIKQDMVLLLDTVILRWGGGLLLVPTIQGIIIHLLAT